MTAAEQRQPPPYFALYAQTIVANGFGILPVLPGKKKPRYPRWQTAGFKLPDPAWLERHVRKYPTDSVGLGCGRLTGIDIDDLDATKAHSIQQAAFQELGETTLIRVGRWPKRTLVYRADDQIDTARFGAVEILARGSQFVGWGIHPDTQQPYYWLDDSPLDADAADLPVIRRDDLDRFIKRISALIGRYIPDIGPPPANDNSAHARSNVAVVRNAHGLVVDHRDEFMRGIVWEEFCRGYRTPEELAARAWSLFAAEAELSRPKHGRGNRRWSYRDALSKAKYLCRKQAALRFRPARDQVQHLNSFRQPGYWTDERKAEHQREGARRAMTPAALIVNRRMLDGVPISAGQCTVPVSELVKQTNLSESAVKTARHDLREVGLWISERGVYVPMPVSG